MSKEIENLCDELAPPPEWLNDEFIIKVIEKSENAKNEVNIIDLKITLASNKNENYCSVLYRAKVEYRSKNELKVQTMLIKVAVEEEGEQKELFKESNIFETEIEMYTVVIPKFEAMLAAIGDQRKLAPRMLYAELTPRKLIVMEDLVALGYKVIKDRALDYEETKAVYEKIAKWHAISYKIYLEQPNFFKSFFHSNLENIKAEENPAFNDGIVNFVKLLESQEDLAHYKPYFEPYIGKTVHFWVNAIKEFSKDRQPNTYYVLCHGDFHHKNMMFKRNPQTNAIEELLLLDFQQCYMGPIVNDVINSKYMIMNGEQRLQNWDELLYFYFEYFKQTLEKLCFKGEKPKMLELRKQLMRHKGLEIYGLTSFLPMLMAIDNGTYDIAQLMTNADLRKEIYKNPDYIAELRIVLPKMLYGGYLEN